MAESPFAAGPLSIDALASPRIVRRGRAYARKGHVLEWGLLGDRLEARVQGIAREPYLVSVEWDGEELLCECSCPFDGEPFCKHGVAALAAALGGPLADGESTDDGEWVPEVVPRRAEELDLRRDRGRRAGAEVRIRNLDEDRYFGRFEVVPPGGRAYRVEIRSHGLLHNHCTCPDFSGNLLGTCKHIESVLHRLSERAPKKTARLASAPPSITTVFVRRVDEPRIWVQRGEALTRGAAELIDRHFGWDGEFRGDVLTDFPAFHRAARRRKGILVCEDAREFADHLAEKEAALARRTDTARRVLSHGSRLPGIRAELYPYQTEGIAFLTSTGRAILADDMGLGKTLQAIAACRVLADLEGVERVLIVCPASLKHQWAQEIERFDGATVEVIQGPIPIRKFQYRRRARFTIVNYELAIRDGALIADLAPDILILDEAQRIKNWRTKTAEAIKAIESRFCFVLTGTPVENRLDDLYSLMQVVDRRILGPLWSFNEQFVDLSPHGTKVLGYRNLDILRKILRPVFLRRDRGGVLSQLPDRIDNRYYVDMTGKQREYMDENVKRARMLLKIAEKRPLSPVEHKRLMAALLRARMACNAAGLVDHETLGSPKLDEFARVLAELCADPHRKVVVFSEWERMIRRAADRAKRLGIGHLILSGSVPTAKRGALLDRFRNDPDARVFFSTDAGGVGLNLQVAQTVVNLDLPWNPARLEQRIARVHRLGQPNTVNVILLIAENSMESWIETVLERKRGLFDAVVGADSNVSSLDMKGQSLSLIRAIMDGAETGAGPIVDKSGPIIEEPGPVSLPPVPDTPPEPTLVDRLTETLGFRLLGVRRTRGGLLVVVVDHHDEEAERAVRDAVKEEARIVDEAEIRTLQSFGDDSPLFGAEILLDRSEDVGGAADPRFGELTEVARRRLKAAMKLAEAGMGTEAVVQAHAAMLARVRALLPRDRDSDDPTALHAAVYEVLLAEETITLDQAGALSRAGDLCRIFADREAPVPKALATRTLEEAAAFIGA